jgi:hypothetical protein
VVIQITEGRDTLDYVYAETLLEALGDRRTAEPGETKPLNPEPLNL